jgi:type III secretion system FlhB-like substrate exporter
MSTIKGNNATIKAAQDAKPGDKTVLINWDAIRELPDQYEVIISEVKFDTSNLKASFSDVGNGNFMPSPDMHYKIAEAKGISGGDNSNIEPIYEEVNISEMNRIEKPSFQKMLVGYRCQKFSTVMEEDGTLRRSSPCTIDYNVWNRCAELWAKEEETTEGYKGNLDKYRITRGSKSWDLYPKYNSKWKRKSHFQSELKFAMQKAETKAHEKTIRELAGLQTGYTAEELQSGRLIFAKVRRSKEALQLEAAAHLGRISQGLPEPKSGQMLFGNGTIETAEEEKPPVFEVVKTNRELIIEALETYKKGDSIPENLIETADNILGWLNKKEDAESDQVYWPKAINALELIEKDIPAEFRVDHKLY